jgi:hypothetical protein
MKRHIYAGLISLFLIFSILPAISLSLINPAVAQGLPMVELRQQPNPFAGVAGRP